MSDWLVEGIVGRIGKGPEEGEYILVDPVWEQQVGNGPIVGYTLLLPREQLSDADGNYLLMTVRTTTSALRAKADSLTF